MQREVLTTVEAVVLGELHIRHIDLNLPSIRLLLGQVVKVETAATRVATKGEKLPAITVLLQVGLILLLVYREVRHILLLMVGVVHSDVVIIALALLAEVVGE